MLLVFQIGVEREILQKLTNTPVTETPFLPPLPEEIRTVLLQRHPFRGFGKPEDIAKAVLFLASEDNTWITGIGLQIDGGALSM